MQPPHLIPQSLKAESWSLRLHPSGRRGARERRASGKVPQLKVAEPGEELGHHRRKGFRSFPDLELHTAEPPVPFMTLVQNPRRQVRASGLYSALGLEWPWRGMKGKGLTWAHTAMALRWEPACSQQLCPDLTAQSTNSGTLSMG